MNEMLPLKVVVERERGNTMKDWRIMMLLCSERLASGEKNWRKEFEVIF